MGNLGLPGLKVTLESTKSGRRDHVRMDGNYIPLGKDLVTIQNWFHERELGFKDSMKLAPEELAFYLLINIDDTEKDKETKELKEVRDNSIANYLYELKIFSPVELARYPKREFLLDEIMKKIIDVDNESMFNIMMTDEMKQ